MKRRDFIKRAGLTGVGFVLLPTGFRSIRLGAQPLTPILSDPALQPKFVNLVPDALAPGFIYKPDASGIYNVKIAKTKQWTGLIDPLTGKAQKTWVWGYGDSADGLYTWPGRTFQVMSGNTQTQVVWDNGLRPVREHLLPLDTSLHWCYSLPGYDQYTIEKDGIPIITHLHGGHTDFPFDGNPEYFYGPGGMSRVVGPQWMNVPGGFTMNFLYDNNVPAGNLWYHDHALGITRLNVYAGLAGFYFVRDQHDTGLPGNPLDLPAWPYEKAYAIQDRMFLATGELFYPAFPGDPAYDAFITDEGATPPPGPTALAEFFGDHMVVNGLIWPKEDVEQRNYRMHLLNGTDSRFMAIEFWEVPAGAVDFSNAIKRVPFHVIGSDQGLASNPTQVNTLIFEPGSRYDIVVDFNSVAFGNRVIMKNIAGDAPFNGDLLDTDYFPERQTDKIMAFDVILALNNAIADVTPVGKDFSSFGPNVVELTTPTVRQVALFEGKDEYGRLQPLLGANTGTPETPVWSAIPWHMPTTETPGLNTTEIWEIYNFTGDAHPVHLHLVHFEVLGRNAITFDAEEDGQDILQHNGAHGTAPAISEVVVGDPVYLTPGDGYVENAPKDMVTALPEQVTRIKATFDKPGRYVWHCHILSHEDHEMMRVLNVESGLAFKLNQSAATVSVANAPNKFSLEQNYPNPFNPSTHIVFELPKESLVKLTVYDIQGREVRTLINNNTYGPGRHSVVWDAKNRFGRNVASGVYIYRIKAGSFTKSLKMNLIR